MPQALSHQEAGAPRRYRSLGEGLDAAEAARLRGEAVAALDILAVLREQFPEHAPAYLRAVALLSQSERFDEAETLLADGATRVPNDPAFEIERARLAQRRGDLTEAIERWQRFRNEMPDQLVGYTGAALALREAGRLDEAEALLVEAIGRFPSDPAPRADHAWLAQVSRDWPEAVRRWDEMRQRHPDQPVGFTAGAVALRELRRFEEAEALLHDAVARFPDNRAPLVEYAWLAAARRDWAEAVRRWALIREGFPDTKEAYLRGAQALSSLWQHEEAEALLAEAMQRFPQDGSIACEHASLAYRRHEFEEAARRFEAVRGRFPDLVAGYTGGAIALRDQFLLPEAEALLEEAHRRFPDDPSPLLEHARIPVFHPLRRERDPEEALRRAERLLAKFPFCEDGYLLGVRNLRELRRNEEADELAQIGIGLLPDSAALAIEHANNARERGDWPEAIWRHGAARQRFPNHSGGAIGLAAALTSSGRDAEAEQVLQEAMQRFPGDSAVFAAFGQIAVGREDWPEALARWRDAQRRFPDDQQFAHRIHEAQLQMTEEPGGHGALQPSADPPAQSATEPETGDDPRAATRDLVMQFESLGGRGLGCEFGMFQREFGAEPLGLLRWADMPYEGMVFALENRFDGVGAPEHTDVFVNRENSRPEYCTVDRRGFMFMRAFVYEDEMPFERMEKQALRRLAFLKDKLIADLEAGGKIFVYRLTDRNLNPEELERLYRAVRSYGDNTLLYVRYEDAKHPNGTVELAAPGLMIGYMDRFKMGPDGQLSASPPSASWLALCRNAHALWLGANRLTDSSQRDSVMPEGSCNDLAVIPDGSSDFAELHKPVLRLDDDGERVRRGIRAIEDLYDPRPAGLVASNKDELYNLTARALGDVPLTYLEFGVWRGWSISAIAQKFKHPDARFYGFDSFEGLPERWDSSNLMGQFSTNGMAPAVTDDRISFITGWFQNSVPSFLASQSFSGPVLVHFDADLYSSTLFLLTTLWHYFEEYHFIFDEFFPDEVNALRDFATTYPLELAFHATTLNDIGRPVQLFGQMRRSEFNLSSERAAPRSARPPNRPKPAAAPTSSAITTPLDYIGIAEGTDKGSLGGDYLRHYEACFAPLRDAEFNLIEIGVLDGASLRMWAKFFTQAQIVGVDINPDCRAHANDRVRVEIGSQEDPEFLHRIAAAYPPQIIIDDGSHRSDHIIFTFERLFPALLPGGHYIVEDLHFHLIEADAERLRGSSKMLATEYFLDLANERIGGRHRLPRLDGLKKHLVAAIESVEFIPQAVIIKKRGGPVDKHAALEAMRPHVEASQHWLNWLNYGAALREVDGPSSEVVEALRTAVALNPRAVVSYQRLSEALETGGERDEAIAVLEQAIERAAPQPDVVAALKSRIDHLRHPPR